MGRTGLRPAEAREQLIEAGALFASSEQLCAMLGVAPAQLPASLRRAVVRGDFVKVCRGGWVARDDHTKTLEHRLPDLRAYIDDMMRHLGRDYYLGFNAAAAAHGAAHRRFTNTVVVTSSRTVHRSVERRPNASPPPRRAMSVTYLHCKDPHRRGVHRRRMPEGIYPPETFVNFSGPEVTILDMVWRPELAGGLDHVATVACDLVCDAALDAETLAASALTYPQTVRQRSGHILEAAVAAVGMGACFDTGPLRRTIPQPAAVTPLTPDVDRFFPPDHDDAPLAVDGRWQVRVNTLLDPDT